MSVRHVVLVSYGEPPEPAFAAQLAYSWRILLGLTRTVAPIPVTLVPLIALARARARCRSWRDACYASPLEPITRDQAEHLGEALANRAPGADWRMHVAWEFRRPQLVQVLEALPRGEQAVVVPMYAAASSFTHALSQAVVAQHRALHPDGATVRVLPALAPELLADLSAAHVREQLAVQAGMTGPDVALVLASHGTLVDGPPRVDTGLAAAERLHDELMGQLRPEFGTVVAGWLNHTRGGRWTEPSVEQALARVAESGYRKVVYFPCGFLADNAESQLEGRVALRAHAWQETRHLPCLNASLALADALAEQIFAFPPEARSPEP
jgi:ferrochelatase